MIVMGLHSGFTLGQHDPGAALIIDDQLIAVCAEERFVGVKSAAGHLPIQSIKACLREANISIRDIDLVVHPGASYPNTAQLVARYLTHYFLYAPPIETINHQVAHLASTFYCSDFDEAMCISYDGYGDQQSGTLAMADCTGIHLLEALEATNSLGLFYSMITSYLGFTVESDEYKVMGLSAYGNDGVDLSPILAPNDSGYRLNTDYLPTDYRERNKYDPFYTDKLESLLGPPRTPGTNITQHHKDVAYGAQRQLEKCVISLATHLYRQTKLQNLCIAGGVALNCVANSRLFELDFINHLFVQPASSDTGLALGCALYGANHMGQPVRGLAHVFKGPTYTHREILDALELTGNSYREVEDPAAVAAAMLSEGKVIAWYQGRSEFGPRALGHRSILADPRSTAMKDEVNRRIKFREDFRPFAPSLLVERAAELFGIQTPSPYMTISFPVRETWREKLGAVVHVDGTSRIQTVSQDTLPLYHRLLSQFCRRTGIPAVLNTSFNVRGQPIVETPLQALATFASTGIHALVMENFVIEKQRQST